MSSVEEEIDHDFDRFYREWTANASANWEAIHQDVKLKESYRRLSAFQGLKHVLLGRCDNGVGLVAHEAHNDALTSHVLASLGAWRSSLQALRACIESMLNCLYFREHPVEYRLWMEGNYRTTFSDLVSYFESHPDVRIVSTSISGLDAIKSEYAKLSKAVHGSSVSFRMTDDISRVLIWSDDLSKLSQWATRERAVLGALSRLIVVLLKDDLSGAKNHNLRSVLGYLIAQAHAVKLKESIGVNIPRSVPAPTAPA